MYETDTNLYSQLYEIDPTNPTILFSKTGENRKGKQFEITYPEDTSPEEIYFDSETKIGPDDIYWILKKDGGYTIDLKDKKYRWEDITDRKTNFKKLRPHILLLGNNIYFKNDPESQLIVVDENMSNQAIYDILRSGFDIYLSKKQTPDKEIKRRCKELGGIIVTQDEDFANFKNAFVYHKYPWDEVREDFFDFVTELT